MGREDAFDGPDQAANDNIRPVTGAGWHLSLDVGRRLACGEVRRPDIRAAEVDGDGTGHGESISWQLAVSPCVP
jgi:hypothetical protein